MKKYICWLTGLVLLVVCPSAFAAKDWETALDPLRTMPVQDAGFIRSAVTFADNHVGAIASGEVPDGSEDLVAVVRWMARPEQAVSRPLLKVTHPEIGEMLGGKRVAYKTLHDPATQQRLGVMMQRNPRVEPALNRLFEAASRLEMLQEDFAIFPRSGTPQDPHTEWLSPPKVRHAMEHADGTIMVTALDREILEAWDALLLAVRADRLEAGKKAAQALSEAVVTSAREQGIALPALGLDAFYHTHRPFAKSSGFYLLAAVCWLAALIFARHRWIEWAGLALLLVGLAEQIIGIICRWVLAGRAPLANMYESFTFAVAGMVLVAVLFEWRQRTRVVGLGAGFLGFVLMVLAHKAPIFDSAIRPVMPALQSSWLTYHVVTIMLSYSAFLLAFFLSVSYLMLRTVAGGDDKPTPGRLPSLHTLDILTYKVIGVGFPLLTAGIVLGAVWAATAWGRPWGWDPKETWSLVTWLIYAVYLHARLIAGWRGRRAAWLSIAGFLCVLFTYFGVNYLLRGLHSYV